MKKLSLLLLLAVLCVVSARAEEITIDFSENTFGLSEDAASPKGGTLLDNEDFKVIATDIAYWSKASKGRINNVTNKSGQNFIVITAKKEGCTITKIEISGYYIGRVNINGQRAASNNGDESGSWTGEASTVNLTCNQPGSFGIHELKITYTLPAGSNPPGTPVFTPASGSDVEVGGNVKVKSTFSTYMNYSLSQGSIIVVEETEVNTISEEITVTIPSTLTDGEYTLNVTAFNDNDHTDGSATYNVYIPAPGTITFDPSRGIINENTKITVTSERADKLEYSINGGAKTTITDVTIENNICTGIIPTPQTAGIYDITVTASNNGNRTTTGTTTYVFVDDSSEEPYVRCLNATDLKAGASIYIGDPNQSPFTLMGDMVSGNALFAEDATLEDLIVTDAGYGTRLYLIPASEGKWYLVNADNAYLYSAQPNYLQFRSDGHKSEYAIEIGGDGLARISTPYVAGMASKDIFIAHSTLNGSNTYLSLYAENISSDAHRTYPCIYYQGKPSAPGDVYFNPAGGEVAAGTKVTIIAPDATSITYTYKKETVSVDGESVTVTVDKPGTIEVTATNRIGDTTGQATYTIAPDVIYHTLTSTNSSTTWSLPASGDWMWYHTSDEYYLLYYPFDETDPNDNIAYDPENIILRKDNSVKYSVMFEQSQSDADAKFAIRKVITNEEDPDYPATAWEFLDIQSNNSRADFQTAEVNINNYNGDTVQIGLKGGKPDWSVKDMQVVSRIKTAIETVEVDAEEADAPVVFYNLQGMRVNAENMTPGIYVRLQGKKATKVLVR